MGHLDNEFSGVMDHMGDLDDENEEDDYIKQLIE
jgi:hypothetical protein